MTVGELMALQVRPVDSARANSHRPIPARAV